VLVNSDVLFALITNQPCEVNEKIIIIIIYHTTGLIQTQKLKIS